MAQFSDALSCGPCVQKAIDLLHLLGLTPILQPFCGCSCGLGNAAIWRPVPQVLLKPLEAIWSERGITRGFLNVAVSQVSLERPRIDTVIRELIAAGVAKHMRMSLDAQPSRGGRSTMRSGGQRRAALGGVREWRTLALP
jgi:hypothetical protein